MIIERFVKEPKTKAEKILREVLIILTATFCGSSVQILVMIPNGMTSGGMPGITRLITHFIPSLPYPLVYYGLSMIVVIVAYFTMGIKEVRRIIALVITYPVMLYLFERTNFTLLDSKDPFLASLLIGVGYGLATGIGYIGGYSSGGTDTIARVLKYKVLNSVRVGDIQMVIDMSIIIISAFVFNVNVALYAIVNAYIAAKVISAVMLGYNGRYLQFDIIASDKEKSDAIAEYVMNKVNRAVTTHVSRGEYTHEERRTITVICTPAESVKIKKFVAKTDPDAFATLMPVTNVWGKRFSDIREVDNT